MSAGCVQTTESVPLGWTLGAPHVNFAGTERTLAGQGVSAQLQVVTDVMASVGFLRVMARFFLLWMASKSV